MINRTQKTSRRPPMNYSDAKRRDGERGVGGGAVSSRSFDLLNSMIYDLKRSVDLKGDCLILCYIHPKIIFLQVALFKKLSHRQRKPVPRSTVLLLNQSPHITQSFSCADRMSGITSACQYQDRDVKDLL